MPGTNDLTMIHGDCMDVLDTLPARSFDAVLTDPPYSSGGWTRSDRSADPRRKYLSDADGGTGRGETFTGDNRDQHSYVIWAEMWMRKCLRLVKPGGSLMVFTDWRQLPATTDALQVAGWVWRGIVTWAKPNARPQPGRFTNNCEYVLWATAGPFAASSPAPVRGYWEGMPPAPKTRIHMTQKPVDLLAHLLRITPPGAHVLDPFAGSGSTGEACQTTGRAFTGVEIDPAHHAAAEQRLRQLGAWQQ